MKSKLLPGNKKDYELTIRDLPKAMRGLPSSYVRVTLPLPASKKEVRASRKALDSTQREFAEVVGVSLETVKAWEAGKRTPEGPASKLVRALLKRPQLTSFFSSL